MNKSVRHLLENFREIESGRNLRERGRRIGSELKFPLVEEDGSAAGLEKTEALWDFLSRKGWSTFRDAATGKTVGAVKPGEMNEHRASCETGYCKVEFSLAHVADLHALHRSVEEALELAGEFRRESGGTFLGFGTQPVTPPGKHLLMKKGRNLFWDRLFGGNDHIAPEDGTDVHLFTVSASNQVHIDVTMDEAVDAVNVFNGLAGAQIALTANSNIWKGRVDEDYRCLGEMFWDWWLKEKSRSRYGVPERKFRDLEDYFRSVLDFPPVYVKREGMPVCLPYCRSLSDFMECGGGASKCARDSAGEDCGVTSDGREIGMKEETGDIDQHFTFFWHNARISRYYTLENRVNDQQPPADIMVVPAVTLGLMENLPMARKLVDSYPWETLREMRTLAAKNGLSAATKGVRAAEISSDMISIAEEGLKRRDLGEERYLAPLKVRLERMSCPADDAERVFRSGGVKGLIEFCGIFS
ncbi:MAG: glutamate-cysteine ligase family protein [Candidatus Sulfobium sp.]